jgi:hypothetical protein
LKKENKLLKKKAKRAKVLKQKAGKLKGIIKELKKQLELADKTHKIKKNKRGRVQGRNPLPKQATSTNSMGTQTDLEELVVEEATTQDEDVIPVETQEMVDAEVQIDTMVLEEIAQLSEKDAIIKRLEEDLIQSQQNLIQSRDELMTITEKSQEQRTVMDRMKAELAQTQQALMKSREEITTHQTSQFQAQDAIINKLKEELGQAQQILAQRQDGMVTRTEYQNFVTELKGMIETEGETYVALTRAQEKVKRVQAQLETTLEKIKHICDVYSDAINYRGPATNYVLFLLERYLLLRVKAIRAQVNPFPFPLFQNLFHVLEIRKRRYNTSCVNYISIISFWKKLEETTLDSS